MENVEAIFLDFDGTLLDDNNHISNYTKSIIKKCEDVNIKIIPASARGFYRIKPYFTELGLSSKDFFICYNGAIVMNNGIEVFSSNIDNKLILLLDGIISKYNIDWYYYLYDSRVLRRNIDDLNQFLQKNKIYKIAGVDNPNSISTIRKELPDFIKENFEITSSFENRISFMNKGINKIVGLKLILNMLNIPQENTVAIGDGENDVEMITYCKYGIAMANSPQLVKNKANIITNFSNNEDGVGRVLNDLLNLERR